MLELCTSIPRSRILSSFRAVLRCWFVRVHFTINPSFPEMNNVKGIINVAIGANSTYSRLWEDDTDLGGQYRSSYIMLIELGEQAVPVKDGVANEGSVEATNGKVKPVEGDASGSARPLGDDGASKGSDAANDTPSESVAAESVVKSEADVDRKD